MDRFDRVERKFGISACCSSHEGFAALVKARYSDFVVHEIDRNGNVACLDSVEIQAGPTNEQTNERSSSGDNEGDNKEKGTPTDGNADGAKKLKRKLSDVEEDSLLKKNKSDGETTPPSEVDWDNCGQELSKLVDEETSKEVVLFLKSVEDGDNQEKKFFTLPTISDKQIRRSIHMLIKSPLLNKIALADNHEGRIRIWHSMFKASIPADNFGPRKGRKRRVDNNAPPWPADRPDFLRFVVYKENIDTSTAAKDIVRMAHCNPKRGISYAGMKDKRGVTSQFCSAYRATKEQLLAVNRSLARPKHGGNTSTRGASVIKVGNFSYVSDEVRLGQLKGNRFDVVLRNVEIGLADDIVGDAKTKLVHERLEAAGEALKSRGFVNYFGMQRFGKFRDTHEVGICILKGDHEGAVDVIMREKGNDSNEYQNTAVARKKWAKRFADVDLSDGEAAKDAEVAVAKDVLRSLGRFMVCEKSIVSSLSRNPRDYKRAFGAVSKQMRSMFLHAYQSYIWNKVASMRIETGGYSVQVGDLVLTEDKSAGKKSGTSGLKGKSVKILTADDVQNHSITDVVLPLVGSKVVFPEGLSGDLFVELMKEDGINREMFAKVGAVDKELSLGGDYRKLICKPSDVTFAIKQYTDPVQPLLETDLMKSIGEKVAPFVREKASESPEAILYGMVVGFSLPPSSYATIAMRELTKRPTSSEYQSMLELTGKPERNVM